MKCLFVHDFRAWFHEANYFTVNLSYDIWRTRYLSLFSEIRICNRCIESETSLDGKMVLSSGDGVTFSGMIPFRSTADILTDRLGIRRAIAREVRETDVAIIRLHSFLGLLAVEECIKQRKPYLIELVGCPWDAFWNHGILGKLVAPYMYIKTKREVKRARYVVYVTKQFLQARYPTNGQSINCSDVELRNTSDSTTHKRMQLIDLPGKKLIIGTTAAVNVRYKGQDTVIKALSQLKRMGFTNCEYQLVGEGKSDYLSAVATQHGVQDQVVFKGPLPHAQVLDWLDSVDIYIQPSKQEGLPRALIEAMSRGCTAFGTKVAGIPELLDEEYLFSPDDVKTLSQKIYGLTADDRKTQAVRNLGVAKEYGVDVLNRRRLEFFKAFVRSC